MSIIPISRFGRDLLDFDNLFGPGLDLFDPFDEHDLSLFSSISPSLSWIDEPPKLLDSFGRQRPRPEKLRFTLNVQGFDKEDIHTKIEGKKLVISGKKHIMSDKSEDFDTREFRKSFELPENVIPNQLTSFVTVGGVLVVEIPIKVGHKHHTKSVEPYVGGKLFNFDEFFDSSFFPKIVDDPSKPGKKKIEMSVEVGSFKPDDVHVSLKDNELIVKAEHTHKNKGKGFSKSYYYKQVTLPPGTDIEHLKLKLESGKLAIEAPYEEGDSKKLKKV